jgi:branched-subunit amino acid transport protein
MADWEIWVVIVVLGIATACCRSALWMVGHRVTIPRRVQEMLRYAPACALAAIVAPDFMLGPQGEIELAVTNPKLLAGIISLAYYLWRRNMLQTIIIGMVVFTVLRISDVFHNGL